MIDLASLLQEPGTTIAVVGATDNSAKYGSVIYRDLKRKGFTVWPVNPNRATVDGDTAYPTLADLPERPTIVNVVVPARIGLEVVAAAAELGLDNVWLQPGAESPRLVAALQDGGFNYLAHACIMVRSRLRV